MVLDDFLSDGWIKSPHVYDSCYILVKQDKRLLYSPAKDSIVKSYSVKPIEFLGIGAVTEAKLQEKTA